jgi:hypothetical protein
MATEKQILANQQNAQHSTGPRTEAGKRRSRRNAVRHGLTAETLIDTLEDAEVNWSVGWPRCCGGCAVR